MCPLTVSARANGRPLVRVGKVRALWPHWHYGEVSGRRPAFSPAAQGRDRHLSLSPERPSHPLLKLPARRAFRASQVDRWASHPVHREATYTNYYGPAWIAMTT